MSEITWKDKATIDAEKARNDALSALKASDSYAVRILEDLLSVLETKGIMTKAELPQSAQDKLANRAALRAKLSS